ncbi:DUF4123 domain-containing protein [Pseudomonas cremoricolorata]|uniref:DUF4123 domain-containing protein n=1 Tax=Pseudomonas cremoricolorata TaxID=157783 RepID=UPI00067F3A5E|nr:DUF4123 domain-containing protein [Pseudomonas cremoricolorata]
MTPHPLQHHCALGLANECRYLLLMTETLEYLAYRPTALVDGEWKLAYVPSVLDLAKDVSSDFWHAWPWKRSVLDEQHDFGPVLIDTARAPELRAHALNTWMPINGAIALDAEVELDVLNEHLTSLVQITLADQSDGIHHLNPNHLSAWLDALDEPNRDRWLGPISRLVWRTNWGPAHQWHSLQRAPTTTRALNDPAWCLSAQEQQRLDDHLHEHFVLTLIHDILAVPHPAEDERSAVRRWVEELLPQLKALNFHSEETAGSFIRLAAQHKWLLSDKRAAEIFTNVKEAPESRLYQLQELVDSREIRHD